MTVHAPLREPGMLSLFHIAVHANVAVFVVEACASSVNRPACGHRTERVRSHY